jgi:hypothetical protein
MRTCVIIVREPITTGTPNEKWHSCVDFLQSRLGPLPSCSVSTVDLGRRSPPSPLALAVGELAASLL